MGDILAFARKEHTAVCSFCKQKVKKYVAAEVTGKIICDSCIIDCKRVLKEDYERTSSKPSQD